MRTPKQLSITRKPKSLETKMKSSHRIAQSYCLMQFFSILQGCCQVTSSSKPEGVKRMPQLDLILYFNTHPNSKSHFWVELETPALYHVKSLRC